MSTPVKDVEPLGFDENWCNGDPHLQAKAGTLRLHLDLVKPKHPLITDKEWAKLLDENDKTLEVLESKAEAKAKSAAHSRLRQKAARAVVSEKVAELEKKEGLDIADDDDEKKAKSNKTTKKSTKK